LESSNLKKLLISNSAHEVRTPLNAIINYLEIALEGALDQETRDCLSKSHSASKSLIYVINDLLDLTKTEEGQELINDEAFDFLATVREATDSFKEEATRKGLQYDLVEHPGLPQWVYGDQRRIRQTISNIIANAVHNTTTGHVSVEVWLGKVTKEETTIEVVVQDSGSGISSKHLDQLFKDLEQVTSDERDNLESAENSNQLWVEGKQDRVLGLGLAVVARTVRNMNGQLRLTSEEGHGSRFIVQLPFSLEKKPPEVQVAPVPLRPVTPNEITLVDNRSQVIGRDTRKPSGGRKGSTHGSRRGSGGSSSSNKSTRSDIDCMIEDFSEPVSKRKAVMPLRERILPPRVSRDSNLDVKSVEEPTPEQVDNAPVAPGYRAVPGEKTLLRAIRMPDESLPDRAEETSKYAGPDGLEESRTTQGNAIKPLDAEHLQILVAEDDPINNRIIKKRLEKNGHEVKITVNGQECATAYQEKLAFFDVVLMDMQVSIHWALS
jgi:CheY-like chemotaxis protein